MPRQFRLDLSESRYSELPDVVIVACDKIEIGAALQIRQPATGRSSRCMQWMQPGTEPVEVKACRLVTEETAVDQPAVEWRAVRQHEVEE